jgi:hypothetical protein
MIDRLMLAVLMLMQAPGQVPAPATGAAAGPSRATGAAATTVAEPAVLAEYNARRAHMGRSEDDQIAMARWCQEHGLRAEAIVHAGIAIERDPKRDAAWKLLGFRKVDGRWLNEEQAHAELEQKEADREWAKRLTSWHKALHGPRKTNKLAARKQAEEADSAREALDRLTDPSAVRTVYREFARGAPPDQEIAVQLFGQIRAPLATTALASLTIYGATPEIRRKATESLRGREPADYAGLLIGLLAKPIHYEVQPDRSGIGGIGSPGVLEIEGEETRLRRTYVGVSDFEASQTSDFSPRVGDIIVYDRDGYPSLVRKNGQVLSPRRIAQQYQNAAQAARARLEEDIAQIKAENAARGAFNDGVYRVLKYASGRDFGDDERSWRNWLADSQGLPREEAVAVHKWPFFQLVKPYAMELPGVLRAFSGPYETAPFT